MLDLAAQDYRTRGRRHRRRSRGHPEDQESGREVRRSCAPPAHPQAQFLWAIFRDIFHYAAVHLEHVADNARDVDFAIRWGFGWTQGPFETWQAAGWSDIAQAGSPTTSPPARP